MNKIKCYNLEKDSKEYLSKEEFNNNSSLVSYRNNIYEIYNLNNILIKRIYSHLGLKYYLNKNKILFINNKIKLKNLIIINKGTFLKYINNNLLIKDKLIKEYKIEKEKIININGNFLKAFTISNDFYNITNIYNKINYSSTILNNQDIDIELYSKYINFILKNFKDNLYSKIKKNIPLIYKDIYKQTSYLNKNVTFSERVFCYVNNIKEKDILCQVCKKKPLKFQKFGKGYSKNCSLTCSNISENKQNQRKKTCLERYGFDSAQKSNIIKKNIKKNNIKKYGVDYPSQLKEIQNKWKKTNLKKYGYENVFQNKQVINKSKLTNLEKYGETSYTKTKEFLEKSQKTCLEKYGYKFTSQVPRFIKKRKKTCLERYGFDSAQKNNLVKENTKKNNLKKYGVDYPSQIHILNYKNYNKEYIEEKFVINNELDLEKLCKYFNITIGNSYKLIKKLNIEYRHIKSRYFFTQLKIFNIIKNLNKNLTLTFNNNKIILNKKNKKLELDIYISNKKIAIEYNGLMFHSFGKSKCSMFNNYKDESLNKKKHLTKTELCEEQNIQLLHINEDEWLNPVKQKIWKSMIKSKLGLLDKKIFARKTIIKEISYKEAKDFLINNHIQGESVSKINLGLFPKDNLNQLIGVMTFGKPRYSKSADWELIRFCSQLDLNIVGGGSKLLNYFTSKYMKENEQLISYGNRRWTYSKKNFYIINGFEFIENSNINYYYFHKKDLTRLYHRSVFQKYKIERYYKNRDKLIFNFDKSLTERINMYNNGYRKIFDCGQLVYRYIKQ